MHKEFEKEEKYKLYRKVEEILHPTISKKNISDYKIIINDALLPIRVFYPKKVSNINKVIIYIHGDSNITNCMEKYSRISADMAKELDHLVISIDYEESDSLIDIINGISKTFEYVYNKLLNCGIEKNNITIMGDSTGGALVLNMVKDKDIDRCVLFYPVLSGEYFGKTNYNSILENDKFDHDLIDKLKEYYKDYEKDKSLFALKNNNKYPNTLLLIGNVDPLIDEAKDFANKNESVKIDVVSFANHGFLNTSDNEIKNEFYDFIKKFVGDENGKKKN